MNAVKKLRKRYYKIKKSLKPSKELEESLKKRASYNLGIYTYIDKILDESNVVKNHFIGKYKHHLLSASEKIAECIENKGKIMIIGNGGSAADAQHMAAEMVGNMIEKRRALPAIALTTDTSNLTAISNDFGYEYVFSRQIEALAQEGDVLFAISTSGNSENVIIGARTAIRLGCTVITLTGGSGGELAELGHINLIVEDGKNSSRIQETHIFAIHSIVDLLDKFFLK